MWMTPSDDRFLGGQPQWRISPHFSCRADSHIPWCVQAAAWLWRARQVRVGEDFGPRLKLPSQRGAASSSASQVSRIDNLSHL